MKFSDLLPYVLVCRRNERRTGLREDFPLFHYPGWRKRIRRIVKFALPYGVVTWYRNLPLKMLREMRRSALGRRFAKCTFDPAAVDLERACGGVVREGRTAVFACFFAGGRIPAATLHYLKKLEEVVDNILVVGDCPILPGEEARLPGSVRYFRFIRHGEYDFGSYRRGWEYACGDPGLASSRELLFCNDSCYGPVGSFRETFARMASSPCDFWGLCENSFLSRHLQSYFLLFRRQVWISPVFCAFMRSIRRQKRVMDVIVRYEIGLSKRLFAAGFTGEACYRLSRDPNAVDLHPTQHPVTLMRLGCPLVKVKAIRDPECNLDGIDETRALLRSRDPDLCTSIFHGV